MSLLAQMRGATDQKLAALAARLPVGLCSTWPRRAGSGPWRGRMASSPVDRVAGDLDLDASLDGLVHARATGELIDAGDLRVRHWTQPATALALVIDHSGSMSGKRLATAAVAARRAPTGPRLTGRFWRSPTGSSPSRVKTTRGHRWPSSTTCCGFEARAPPIWPARHGGRSPTRSVACQAAGHHPDVRLPGHDRADAIPVPASMNCA